MSELSQVRKGLEQSGGWGGGALKGLAEVVDDVRLAFDLNAVLARLLDGDERRLVHRAARRAGADVADQVGRADRTVLLVVDLAPRTAHAAVVVLDHALERCLELPRLAAHLDERIGRDRKGAHDWGTPQPDVRERIDHVGPGRRVGAAIDDDWLEVDRRRLCRRGQLAREGIVVELQERRVVLHEEDLPGRVAVLRASSTRDAHLLQGNGGLRCDRPRELVEQLEVAHRRTCTRSSSPRPTSGPPTMPQARRSASQPTPSASWAAAARAW